MKKLIFTAIISAAMICWASALCRAQTEEIPQFAGVAVFPSVFFIFDTSDSMNEVPYRTQYGGAYIVPVNSWRWQDAISLDANGNPLYSGDGFQTIADPARSLDPNPLSYLSGGNHPESKLYQAKVALRDVLSGIDNVNMGFATYLQERVPKVTALYYNIEPAVPGGNTTRPDQWLVKYKKLVSTVYTGYRDTTAPNRMAFCGTHNDFVGYRFPCTQNDAGGCVFAMTYEVYNIAPGYGADGNLYRHMYRCSFDGYRYASQYVSAVTYPNCPANVPATYTGGYTILAADEGASCKPCLFYPGTTYVVTGVSAYYRFNWYDTYGSWDKGAGVGGYINPTTLQVTPSTTYSASWTLLQSNLTSVLAGTAGTTVNASPTQFDSSIYRYPSDGTTNKPHAWSYVHTIPTSPNSLLWNRTWPDSSRRNPYFPDNQTTDDYLGDATELDNYSGDDNIFFVHLPDPDLGDDEPMASRDRILSFLSLNRATYPVYNCQVSGCGYCPTTPIPYIQYTMMPFTQSIPSTTQVAVLGQGTPLGATLTNAKDYYQGYINQDNQTQIGCRENYVILLTDGLETCGGNPVQAATQLLGLRWHEGLADQRDTPVKTYVIGFGLDATSASSLNDIAEAGGTDHAYFATNLPELISTLTNIFQAITAGSYTRSDPVISREGDSIYSAYFDYPGWKGHVVKYLVDSNGNVTGRDTTWYDDPTPAPGNVLEGDAGAKLNERSAATRSIYTATSDWGGAYPPPSRVDFDDGQAPSLHAFLNPGDFNEDSSTNQTDSVELINYVRDVTYNGGAYAWASRDNTWKLGDIYHSTPLAVTPPQFDLGYRDYDGFKQDHSGRTSLVVVGANDGMLHAFNAADGTEEWAYIPKCVLGNLKGLKNGHTYFVDLPAKAADIWSAGGAGTVFPSAGEDKEGWHSALVGGLRKGGNYYFALDLTDTDSNYPKPLWEITDGCMGQTWSTPTFGRVRVSGADKYVAFVGGGYSTDSNVGNSFYIINVEEGNFLKKFANNTSPASPVGSATEKVPAQVRAVDLDRNGYIERVYFANTSGKLYKLDLTSEDTGNWQVVELFDPGSYDYTALPTTVVPTGASLPGDITQMNRPVFYPPAVVKDRYGEQHYIILYGTGNDLDPQATDTQDFFFAIEDLNTGAGGGQCNWVYVFCSSANACSMGTPPVDIIGEKCLSRPIAFADVVYFTTYTPTQLCGAGQGFIYGLGIFGQCPEPAPATQRTCGGQGALQYDLQGSELETPAAHTEIGSIFGIPSSPVVTNGMMYFNASNNTNVGQLRIPALAGQLRSWQEVF